MKYVDVAIGWLGAGAGTMSACERDVTHVAASANTKTAAIAAPIVAPERAGHVTRDEERARADEKKCAERRGGHVERGLAHEAPAPVEIADERRIHRRTRTARTPSRRAAS